VPAKRVCPRPGCPALIPAGARYCPTHAREYETRRGTRQARGYDARHNALRADWQRRIDRGERVVCATCPTVLTGRTWDLGHADDRRAYIGPQCLPCNRGDGGRRGRAAQDPGGHP
jgi:hypothetical protein